MSCDIGTSRTPGTWAWANSPGSRTSTTWAPVSDQRLELLDVDLRASPIMPERRRPTPGWGFAAQGNRKA